MSRIAASGYLEKKVYESIKEMIVQGELKSGDQIIQDQLATKLGVSRTPIRKAIADLERDYLLETTSEGIFIRKFSVEFITSVWEVRTVLEGLACKLAANHIDLPTIAYFRALFEGTYQQFLNGDSEYYRRADIEFHNKIFSLSKNPVLQNNVERTNVLEIAFVQGLLRSPHETFEEHMNILDSFERRDSEASEKLMIEHCNKTKPNIAKKFSGGFVF